MSTLIRVPRALAASVLSLRPFPCGRFFRRDSRRNPISFSLLLLIRLSDGCDDRFRYADLQVLLVILAFANRQMVHLILTLKKHLIVVIVIVRFKMVEVVVVAVTNTAKIILKVAEIISLMRITRNSIVTTSIVIVGRMNVTATTIAAIISEMIGKMLAVCVFPQ